MTATRCSYRQDGEMVDTHHEPAGPSTLTGCPSRSSPHKALPRERNDMSPYLTHMAAEAHTADLREQAARRTRPVPVRRRGPSRLRNVMAQLLLGLAVRLDRRLQPTAA